MEDPVKMKSKLG